MTDDLQRAVEAARRIVSADLSIADYLRRPIREQQTIELAILFDERGKAADDSIFVAQWLLSIISTRDDVIEQCAKVADGIAMEQSGAWRAGSGKVAARLRSLKSSTSL